MGKWTENIPSFVWILIIVAAIALFIGAMMGGFFAVTHIEGIGSIILLVCAWCGLRFGANSPDLGDSSFGIAALVVFFALMGIGFDQPGNFIYNKPLKWIFCPADSELIRDVSRSAARGGVSVSQNFTCVAENGGQVLRTIAGWEHFSFRFIEYVLLGYILLGLSRFYTRLKGFRRIAVRDEI